MPREVCNRDGFPDRVDIGRGQAVVGEQSRREVDAVDLEPLGPVGGRSQTDAVQDAAGEQQLLVVVVPRSCPEMGGQQACEQIAADTAVRHPLESGDGGRQRPREPGCPVGPDADRHRATSRQHER
jgi:hypothetical protein